LQFYPCRPLLLLLLLVLLAVLPLVLPARTASAWSLLPAALDLKPLHVLPYRV
jgi:hypothetical protein